MTRPPQVALLCRGLTKRYAQVTAVDGLDLEVRSGECFGLLGPNGAGKTTTIEILQGLTSSDSGTVEVLGQTWSKGNDYALRERLGVQLQETQLADKLKVKETVRLFRSFYKRGRDVDDVIRMMALGEYVNTRVENLSGGTRQRLSIGCALVGDAELLFLDEPTAGLDPRARLKIWAVLEEFRAGGGTIFLTTHYMEEAERLCDRIAILDRGRCVAQGTPLELIESLGTGHIIEFTVNGELREAILGDLPGVRSVSAREGIYTISASATAVTLPLLLAEIERQTLELRTLSTHMATLDDVFVSLTGRVLDDV